MKQRGFSCSCLARDKYLSLIHILSRSTSHKDWHLTRWSLTLEDHSLTDRFMWPYPDVDLLRICTLSPCSVKIRSDVTGRSSNSWEQKETNNKQKQKRMKPIKLTSGVYRIKDIKCSSSSKFYRNLKVGTKVRFELEMGVIEKTSQITIYNLTNNTSYVSPAHKVRSVFWKFNLEEVLPRCV